MADRSDLIYRPVPEGIYKEIITKHFADVDLKNGAWISGGSVRKVWFNLPWMDQDVDYFFPSRAAFDLFVNKINLKFDVSNNNAGVFDFSEVTRKSPHMTCYSTDNANTYTFEQFNLIDQDGKDTANLEFRFKLQAIKKYFPTSVEELFGSFDFTVCQFATDGRMMVATKAAVEDCEANRMSMIPSTPRKISILRMAKYCAYGFTPDDSLMEHAINSMANNEPLGELDEY